jgi:anti-sigma regulatory factor (Ser/Thr protein kinase)
MCQSLPARATSVATARGVARHFFTVHVEDDDVLEELLLATSELVTNAVKFGRDGQRLWLHLLATPRHLAVTVTDAGAQACVRSMSGPRPPATAEGGRGLAIVRTVSDELTVFCGPTTVVRAVKRVRRPV